MPKEQGYGQLKHSGGAWSHAQQTSAPPILKSHEKAHSKAMDPSRPGATLGHKVAQRGKRGGKD